MATMTAKQSEDEEPERHHCRSDESGEHSRDPTRVDVCGTPLTCPEREVEMEVQVDMPVLLLLWFKTLPLAL
jgi:hypothetical protein